MIKLGITGTQPYNGCSTGFTHRQMDAFTDIVGSLRILEFHNGDCLGVDDTAHKYFRNYLPNIPIIGHPPEDPKARAFNIFNETRKLMPYLMRNRVMVNEIQVLIVVPQQQHEILRSGTWATYRYAVKMGRRIILLKPHQG